MSDAEDANVCALRILIAYRRLPVTPKEVNTWLQDNGWAKLHKKAYKSHSRAILRNLDTSKLFQRFQQECSPSIATQESIQLWLSHLEGYQSWPIARLEVLARATASMLLQRFSYEHAFGKKSRHLPWVSNQVSMTMLKCTQLIL
jgi:hypothetical protein